MACSSQLLTGRTVAIAFALENCEATPLTTATTPISTWKNLGLIQNFTETMTQRTTTATVQGESQTLTETTGIDFSVSLSSLIAPDVAAKTNVIALRDFILTNAFAVQPVTPKMWIRLADSGLTEYRYYYVTANIESQSGENEGNRAADITFTGVPTNQSANASFQKEAIV